MIMHIEFISFIDNGEPASIHAASKWNEFKVRADGFFLETIQFLHMWMISNITREDKVVFIKRFAVGLDEVALRVMPWRRDPS